MYQNGQESFANNKYKVLNTEKIPQGHILFCLDGQNRVVIKDSELMNVEEHDIVRSLMNLKQVADVSDIIHPGKKQYYVMESSDYTLENQLCESPNQVKQQIRFIMKQLINGICELHNRGWIHMEIDAKSIIVKRTFDAYKNYQDTYKISIWESFKEMWQAQTKSRAYWSEFRYISVLQRHKNPENTKIDLWAFGLLVFKLYTGIDIEVQNKYRLTDDDYKNIKKCLYHCEHMIDADIFPHLQEIFDRDFQKSAQEIADYFINQRRLQSIIVSKRNSINFLKSQQTNNS